MTRDQSELDAAYKAYLRDKSASTGLALSRALRLSGHAEEAIRVAKEIADQVKDPFLRAQVGIDMNYLGLFAQAEPLLMQSLAELHHEPDRRVLKVELVIAQYAQGRFREAHALNRRSRDAWGRAGVVSNIYPSDTSEYGRIVNKLLRFDESAAGRRVLILQEGGLGDVIMFSRYLHLLRDEGASAIVLQAPGILAPIFASYDWVTLVENASDAIDQSDCILCTFDLFARYQTTPYFPSWTSSYVQAPAGREMTPRVADTFNNRRDGVREIGLIWRSGTSVRHEPYRSIALEQLAPLFGAPECRFHALQFGKITDEEHALLDQHGIGVIGDELNDLGDTAVILNALDLLITVDTGPAHLAGALGRPVWLLLSAACDERWSNTHRDTPWYRSMHLYRQPALGDWSSPISEMADALSGKDAAW
ncbi:glycosyltransferase family 9 protein [Burkholderia sp. Ac-20384]|uniref:glycosyltransferase family 9 protein n=1 Tax=Burkholderia sp. Ac-20384 TaxID=2703902 RepID=UPI00197D0D4F|nr:glycosyltransferase family 9 protein [Burkholderia sp. Ac-20384]MBN3822084.1 glycosyltransferase family 9 protein [Burkholderia sp. Ac-20384]